MKITSVLWCNSIDEITEEKSFLTQISAKIQFQFKKCGLEVQKNMWQRTGTILIKVTLKMLFCLPISDLQRK